MNDKKIRKLLKSMGEYEYYVDHQLHLDPEHVVAITTHIGDKHIIGSNSEKEAMEYIFKKVGAELFWRCEVICDRKNKSL